MMMAAVRIARKLRAEGMLSFWLGQFFGFLGYTLLANHLLRLAGQDTTFAVTQPLYVIGGAVVYSVLMTAIATSTVKDAEKS